MSLLLEPFNYTFMVRAMWVAGLVGVMCGMLSCFVTLKGWSLLGDALSHAVVPGVVIANLLSVSFALSAFIAGLLAAIGIGGVRRYSGLKGDAAIGVVFTAFFALGLVLISAFPSMLSLQTILFGNLLGIAQADALQLLVIGLICTAVILLRWKDLVLFTFDEYQASTQGLNVRWLHLLMLSLVALVAVAALQAVGAILVMAMLITPGATAYLLTNRFSLMMWIASLLGGGLAMLGGYLSFLLDTSVGGVIVLLQTAAFLLAFLFAPERGILRFKGAMQ